MHPTLPSLGANLASQPFKRSQLGLFHGKTKQYGNNVPFSKHKTRRTWLPNVQRKRLFSETLGEDVRVKLTTRALKTIKKHGGVDNYTANTRLDLLGWEGMRIRLLVRQEKEQQALRDNTKNAIQAHRYLCGTRRGRKTARKNAEEEVRKEARKDADKIKRTQKPTLSSANDTRVKAAAVFGISDRLPSAKETIMYLQSRKREMDRILRH